MKTLAESVKLENAFIKRVYAAVEHWAESKWDEEAKPRPIKIELEEDHNRPGSMLISIVAKNGTSGAARTVALDVKNIADHIASHEIIKLKPDIFVTTNKARFVLTVALVE